MRQWFAGLRKRVGGLLATSPEQAAAVQRREVVAHGLKTISGTAPTKEQINAVLDKQAVIDALHHRLRDENDAVDMDALLSFDGMSHLQALKDKHAGYLFVFAQGFLGGILDQLTKSPKPIVSAVFKPHEDPSAHRTLFERGHGLGFELLFYPSEDPAMVTTWFDRLVPVTTKPAAFAVSASAPVFPVWCRVTSKDEITLEIAAPLAAGDDPATLTLQLTQHFAKRMCASPEEIDWEADCWYPPIKHLLTSRRRLPLVLPKSSKPQPLKLLVRVPDSIREACLAVPAVRALKQGRPDVHLTALTASAATPFWRIITACDHVLTLEDPKADSTEPERYDFGLVLAQEDHAVTQLKRYSFLRLVGMESHPQSEKFDEALNMPRKLGPPEHHHRTYLRVAHRMGADVEDPELWSPIRPYQPSKSETKIIGVAPESEVGSSYEWPKERFLKLISEIPNPVAWRIFTSRNDAENLTLWETELTKLGVAIEVWQSEGNLLQDLAALQQCQVVVSNDNDWLHLATVAGLPSVAIYGPSEPIETAPVADNSWTVRKHVECTPCFLAECPMDHRCLQSIKIRDVQEPLQDLLKRF